MIFLIKIASLLVILFIGSAATFVLDTLPGLRSLVPNCNPRDLQRMETRGLTITDITQDESQKDVYRLAALLKNESEDVMMILRERAPFDDPSMSARWKIRSWSGCQWYTIESWSYPDGQQVPAALPPMTTITIQDAVSLDVDPDTGLRCSPKRMLRFEISLQDGRHVVSEPSDFCQYLK